ncbi:PREDICTED: RING finger protein 11 [Pygoscelis adeliae]|nr:PREDICTED: RING finger protein 11 [Pygoscelis adeliae]
MAIGPNLTELLSCSPTLSLIGSGSVVLKFIRVDSYGVSTVDSERDILGSMCSSLWSDHTDGDSSKQRCWRGSILIESKNWENGSNNYVTDATKQAVGVEGADKCFHLRVSKPKSRRRWGCHGSEGPLSLSVTEHAAQKSKGQAPFHALLAIIPSHWSKQFHNMLKTSPGTQRGDVAIGKEVSQIKTGIWTHLVAYLVQRLLSKSLSALREASTFTDFTYPQWCIRRQSEFSPVTFVFPCDLLNSSPKTASSIVLGVQGFWCASHNMKDSSLHMEELRLEISRLRSRSHTVSDGRHTLLIREAECMPLALVAPATGSSKCGRNHRNPPTGCPGSGEREEPLAGWTVGMSLPSQHATAGDTQDSCTQRLVLRLRCPKLNTALDHCWSRPKGKEGTGEGKAAVFLLLEISGDAHSGPYSGRTRTFQKVVALSRMVKAHVFRMSVVREGEFGNGTLLEEQVPVPVYHPTPSQTRLATQLTEEEQIRIAQRIGLIQHLPKGVYDPGRDGSEKKIRECVICMMDFVYGDPIRFLPCMHIYHLDCIDDWLMRSFTCPSCMEPVDAALLSSYETN